jgi:hypothetical protein
VSITPPLAKAGFCGFILFAFVCRIFGGNFSDRSGYPWRSGWGAQESAQLLALLARLTEARRLRTHYHDHDPQTPQRAVHSSDESQSNRQSRHSSADAIILDLEDSIAPEQKELARHSAHLIVASPPMG